MKIRNYSKVIALPFLLLSVTVANAASNREAIQACSEAIATSIEKKQGVAPKLRVDVAKVDPDRRLRSASVYYLEAFSPSADEVVGQYDCFVTRRAKVRTLRQRAPEAPILSPQPVI